MSFAATLGLVALVQLGMPHLFAAADSSTATRVALWGGRELALLTLASLVAGLATTPYAAFHFHRVTPYGVLANLAAMPVVSALVMPAGLLGLLAMPFGLDGLLWQLMGWGIDWMIAVTQWVARLPGAVGRITAFGTGPLIAASAGIIVLGLLRTPLRWAGGVMLLVALAWAFAVPQPDILILGDGRNIAVRAKDGRLQLMRTAKDAFLVKEWLAADADSRTTSDPSLGEGASCDEAGCVIQMADGGLVAQALRSEALSDDCARASLIVSTRQPPKSCAAPVIDHERLQQQGGLALQRTSGGFLIDAVRAGGADRPWAPTAAGGPEPDMVLGSRPRAPRAPDATPSDADLQADE
jgi:competence protein ComEC